MLELRFGDSRRAAEQYFRATETCTALIRSTLNADLASLVSDENDLPTKDQLRRFWQRRAAMAGVTIAEQLASHYDRLQHARRNFPRNSTVGSPHVHSASFQRLSMARELDDRGVIFVRRGPPQQRLVTEERLIGRVESWVYANPSDYDVFHFALFDVSVTDYTLFSGIINCDRDLTDFYLDRATYDARIARAYTACRSSDPTAGQLRVAQLEAEARLAAVENAHALPVAAYDRPLDFYYSVQTVKAESDFSPLVVAVVAIPVQNLSVDSTGGEYRYSFRTTATLFDPETGLSAEVDSSMTLVQTKLLPRNGQIRLVLEIPGVSGDAVQHRIRVADLIDERAGKVYAGSRPIQDFRLPGLHMSDLIFTRVPGGPGGWQRGSQTLDVVPVERFRGGSFGLYFELYNADPEPEYEIEVEIARKGRSLFRNRESVRIAFREQATDTSITSIIKTLQIPSDPGQYSVKVTVTSQDESEQTVAERILWVP